MAKIFGDLGTPSPKAVVQKGEVEPKTQLILPQPPSHTRVGPYISNPDSQTQAEFKTQLHLLDRSTSKSRGDHFSVSSMKEQADYETQAFLPNQSTSKSSQDTLPVTNVQEAYDAACGERPPRATDTKASGFMQQFLGSVVPGCNDLGFIGNMFGDLGTSSPKAVTQKAEVELKTQLNLRQPTFHGGSGAYFSNPDSHTPAEFKTQLSLPHQSTSKSSGDHFSVSNGQDQAKYKTQMFLPDRSTSSSSKDPLPTNVQEFRGFMQQFLGLVVPGSNDLGVMARIFGDSVTSSLTLGVQEVTAELKTQLILPQPTSHVGTGSYFSNPDSQTQAEFKTQLSLPDQITARSSVDQDQAEHKTQVFLPNRSTSKSSHDPFPATNVQDQVHDDIREHRQLFTQPSFEDPEPSKTRIFV